MQLGRSCSIDIHIDIGVRDKQGPARALMLARVNERHTSQFGNVDFGQG